MIEIIIDQLFLFRLLDFINLRANFILLFVKLKRQYQQRG